MLSVKILHTIHGVMKSQHLCLFKLRKVIDSHVPRHVSSAAADKFFSLEERTSNQRQHDSKMQPCSHFHPSWDAFLSTLNRPIAKALATEIDRTNALGYPCTTKKSRSTPPLFLKVLNLKRANPTNIYLTRIGEFYEAIGIDALVVIEYCGLNPMGRRLQAGFPRRSIQDILDQLIHNGITVSIIEEDKDELTSRKKTETFSNNISRSVRQIVSPVNPVYLNDLILRQDLLSVASSRATFGMLYQAVSGYSLVEVDIHQRIAVIDDRLTQGGVITKLKLTAPFPPIYLAVSKLVNPSQNSKNLSSLFDGIVRQITTDNYSSRAGFTVLMPPQQDAASFAQSIAKEICSLQSLDFEGFKVDSRCLFLAFHIHARQIIDKTRQGSLFLAAQSGTDFKQFTPKPLSPSVATALGLLPSERVPDLIDSVLPLSASIYNKKFLRNWLVCPPPADIADTTHSLCQYIDSSIKDNITDGLAILLGTSVIPVGKAATLIRALQCNVPTFKQILTNIEAVYTMLNSDYVEDIQFSEMVWKITRHESCCGLALSLHEMKVKLKSIIDTITQVIEVDETIPDVPKNIDIYLQMSRLFVLNQIDNVNSLDTKEEIYQTHVASYLNRQENRFRGRIKRHCTETLSEKYDRVEEAAKQLLRCILWEFANKLKLDEVMQAEPDATARFEKLAKCPFLMHDTTQNTIYVDSKMVPFKKLEGMVTLQSRKNEKVIKLTTKGVIDFSWDYLEAIGKAEKEVELEIKELCEKILPHLEILRLVSTFIIVAQTLTSHVQHAREMGWTLPAMEPIDLIMEKTNVKRDQHIIISNNKRQEKAPFPLELIQLSPFWLSRPQHGSDGTTARCTNLTLSGMSILTAPNMGGKSTLLRSAIAIVLLGNCGLFVPCATAKIPRCDGFFLRECSSDVPSEGRSGFGQEMVETVSILKDVTPRSLVMFDELGRGTSNEDGMAIAGAVLEDLGKKKCRGIFSTHLHGLFDYISLKDLQEISLGYELVNDNINWTFEVIPGRSNSSLGLLTAKYFGLSDSVLARAKEIYSQVVKKQE